MPLNGFHCSKSLRKAIDRGEWEMTIDTVFAEVMAACADRDETWINHEITEAYTGLHEHGAAHSIEIWQTDDSGEKKLVGGLYGVAVGGVFFGESMFHRVTNASKVALFYLVEHLKAQDFKLLEIQFMTPHLKSLGAVEIPAAEYEELLKKSIRLPRDFQK